MGTRRGKRVAALLAAAVVLSAVTWATIPGTSSGHRLSAIPAGYDLFETDPGSTHFTFQDPCTPIPQGFFGPGSEPFQGTVRFAGVPLGSFNGQPAGDADTVVQRLQPADPPAVVPIELVQLSLHSVEPITVRYANLSTEQWSVTAAPSPTQPSVGQVYIHAPLFTGGGTFDSQLRVIPKLTFTRISDGQTRIFDGATLPQQCQQLLTLQQTGGVWAPGCVLPALGVSGLNDGFCPGLNPPGQKQLTVEQSLLANHGVYPAQPALEHFKCFTLVRSPFKKQSVVLQDQFGSKSASVTARAELCNPAQKNTEPFVNKTAHLQCYATSGADIATLVAVQNQFGSQRLVVHTPQRLCLPTEKRLLSAKFGPFEPKTIDPFLCYGVTVKTGLQTEQHMSTVSLKDEFGREKKVKVGKPVRLCAPVAVQAGNTTTPLRHPVKHLVCYKIQDKAVHKKVEIRNAFETQKLVAVYPVLLCVPSAKVVAP